MNSRERRKSKRAAAMADDPMAGYHSALPAPQASPQAVAGEALVETAFRRRAAARGVEDDEDVFNPRNFARVHNKWWMDGLLPSGVLPYFAAAFGVCTAIWLLGLFIRLAASGFGQPLETIWEFIKNPEWQTQPLLLFAHFTALRLFKGIYSRNYDRAFTHLEIKREEVEAFRAWFFGRRVNLGAVLLSVPFMAYKGFVYFPSDAFLRAYGLAYRGGEAWFLMGLWSVEWVIFGYYCYLILTGAVITYRILGRHPFREPVDLVLAEQHYKPLFNTTAQAASLIFCFALIHAGYLFYTGGDWSDYVGLSLLILLLAVSFLMTWDAVRRCLASRVSAAVASLEKSYRGAREMLEGMQDSAGMEDDLRRIQVQLKMSLALQQMEYLQSKYESVGRREMLGMFFRMMAPVGGVVARAIRWGSLLAALGLGSAAIFQNR